MQIQNVIKQNKVKIGDLIKIQNDVEIFYKQYNHNNSQTNNDIHLWNTFMQVKLIFVFIIQNAHAYINAGFYLRQETKLTDRKIENIRIVYGGLGGKFVSIQSCNLFIRLAY